MKRHCLHFAQIPYPTHRVYDKEGAVETCAECAAWWKSKSARVEEIEDPEREFSESVRPELCDCDEPILEEVERGLIQRTKIILCRKCDKPSPSPQNPVVK
jgi:hypothetical protein